jgi:hypothetical protein
MPTTKRLIITKTLTPLPAEEPIERSCDASLERSAATFRLSLNSIASLGESRRVSAPQRRLPPPPLLACTRFNNKTWQEYQDWLNTHQQSYEQIYQRPLKCIYGSPREISHKKFPPQANILVIEMNNDENKIMGIGEIQNQTASETYKPVAGGAPPPPFRKIFSDRNYTRYIYIGNTRYASREELERNHTEDAQYINAHLANIITLLQTATSTSPPPPPSNSTVCEYLRRDHPPSWGGGTLLERMLFKGARHMKRGSGITRVRRG